MSTRRKVLKCNVKLNVKNSNDDDEILEKDEKEEKDKEKDKVKFDAHKEKVDGR